jgi:hypothetical protein
MAVIIFRILINIFIAYVVIALLIYIFQRSLQYFPNRNHPGTPAENGLKIAEAITVTTDDELQLNAWFAPPEKDNGKVVVFFHGNAGHMAHRASKVAYFIDAGYGVYLCEYRGYGGNPGSPNEQGLYMDARAGLEWLRKHGFSEDRLVLYGESIGSGVATQMATEIAPHALIIEAGFSSSADVAKKTYFFLPVDLMVKDRYDNLPKIPKVKTNLLIVHGDEDQVIPISLAKQLFDAANHPKEFITINHGGHNDLYDHHAGHVIVEWLKKHD